MPILSRNANQIMTAQKQAISDNIANRNIVSNIEEPFKIPYKGGDLLENSVPVGSSIDQNMIARSHFNSPHKVNVWQPKINLQTYKSSKLDKKLGTTKIKFAWKRREVEVDTVRRLCNMITINNLVSS